MGKGKKQLLGLSGRNYAEVRRQRDDLLEALEKIEGGHGIPDDTLATGGLYGWAQGVAREAIAKVRGGDDE